MNKSQQERAKSLAEDHWSYLEELLETHRHLQEVIEACGFHYVTAFVHGYKHAMEDVEAAKVDIVPPQIYHEERGMERLNNGG